jgi:hypothetical protein
MKETVAGSMLMRVPRTRTITTLAYLVMLGAVLGGCGDDSQVTFAPPSGSGAGDDGPQHVHGLGVNPSDDALMIATHSGLFRAAAGSDVAERVTDQRQDTMGFTVVGPDRFLGSGHPDLRENLPPLLGLIRSQDAGQNWEPVSLLGRADFHVLRAAGARLYGVNATDGRLYVSADGGRTWAKRTPPAPLLDLAAAPGRAEQVVASTEDGLFVSRDVGLRWRPMNSEAAGLLAWSRDDVLYLVDGAGQVFLSADGGSSWRERGGVGGRPAAFVHDGPDLYVALHTNEVKVSTDGGRSWRPRVRP